MNIRGAGMRRAQSILEYSVMLAVILFALGVMQVYIKRAYSGRIKQESDSIGGQYAPKHTVAKSTANLTVTSVSYTGGNITTDLSGNALPEPVNLTDGMTMSVSHTESKSSKKEAVDSFNQE